MKLFKYSELSNRFWQLDLFRGFVLLYMAFVNAYYALSKTQSQWLSHDGAIMSAGDIIIVFFFSMIGFNLRLVRFFRKYEDKNLLLYAFKRGTFIIFIGLLLISYSFFYSFGFYIIFRSFLTNLGIAMILTAGILFLIQNKQKYLLWLTLSGTLLMFFISWTPKGHYRFLNLSFLLTSFWGYLFAGWFLENKNKFLKSILIYSVLCAFFAIVHYLISSEMPSRRNINASYILISWGVISISISAFIHFFKTEKRFPLVALSGAHPLSFWIIQSVIIGAFVVVSTLLKVYFENLEIYSSIPAIPRNIENHTLAVIVSLTASLLCFFLHLLFIDFYRKKK
ncbi:MAG: hypothetical protein OEZ13_03025 [Spirochaetia bacterium]|nr:hypothetical protein [Spirochaetia bacterium]